ncbi:uncharacterized protein LOC135924197 [Gordionus sp. m RMFG-2023]|uniref:uncharacterized protein LOC135924197 n=1 Tax=Gordionus sp. m RMFG-2023 TaxID=3053472 RepID=UPI0031FBC359
MDMLKGLNNSKEIIYQRDLAITSNHMPYLFTPAFITFNYLTILNANWVYSNQFIFIHSRRERIMVKPKHHVWKHFQEVRDGKSVKAVCKFCKMSYITHVDRMVKHLLSSCTMCPVIIKEKFYSNSKISTSTKNITNVICNTSKSISNEELGEISENDYQMNNILSCDSGEFDSLISNQSTSKAIKYKSQSCITGFIDRINPKEKNELDQLFAKAVYASNLLFHITENPYIQEFFKKIRPIYTLPRRRQLAGYLLDKASGDMEVRVADIIDKAPYLSIVSDGWSNIRNESIINFMVMTPVPVFYKFLNTEENRHTADYIAQEFQNVIHELNPVKVYSLVTDNAANMKAAWRILKSESIYNHIQCYGCAAHTLQLFFHDFKRLDVFSDHISIIKKIVKFFKNKHIPAAVFSRNKNLHGIPSTLSTKPNKMGIVNKMYGANSNMQESSKSITILQPLATSLLKVQGDKCTLTQVKNEMLNLEKHIIQSCHDSIFSPSQEKKIKVMFEKRKTDINTCAHNAAYLLDPRYQGEHLTNTEFDEACNIIQELEDSHNMWKVVTSIRNNQISASSWWNAFCPPCPLREVANILLTFPSSTSSSERNWSVWGNIHTKNRNRLKASTAGKLVIVYYNLRLIKNIKENNDIEYESEQDSATEGETLTIE